MQTWSVSATINDIDEPDEKTYRAIEDTIGGNSTYYQFKTRQLYLTFEVGADSDPDIDAAHLLRAVLDHTGGGRMEVTGFEPYEGE